MARRYSQIDPWFIQRGYKRTSTRMCYYRLKQGELQFELEIDASPSKYDPASWTTLITYLASLRSWENYTFTGGKWFSVHATL